MIQINSTKVKRLLNHTKYLKIIGLLIFVYIISTVDFQKFEEVLGNAKVSYVVGAFLITLFLFFFRAVRYYFILSGQSIRVPFREAISIYFKSSFLGFITPAKVGEMSRIKYLEKYNVSLEQRIGNLLIDRITELICLFIWMIILTCYMLLYADLVEYRYILYASAGACLVFMCVVLLNKQILRAIDKYNANVAFFLTNMFKYKNIILIMLVNMVMFGVYFISFFVMAKGLNLDLDFFFVAFCASSSEVVSMIPITYAGIGTRDAWLIFLFKQNGLAEASAILFSAFFLMVYLQSLIVSGAFFWDPFSKAKT